MILAVASIQSLWCFKEELLLKNLSFFFIDKLPKQHLILSLLVSPWNKFIFNVFQRNNRVSKVFLNHLFTIDRAEIKGSTYSLTHPLVVYPLSSNLRWDGATFV